MKKFSRYQVATAIAILFHVIGFTGILFFDRDLFIEATCINLLLVFVLLLYTQNGINRAFVFFVIGCFLMGIAAEIIGTKKGWLFGRYSYGNVLGPKLEGVPLIIGINWFIIIYCCGVSIYMLLNRIMEQLSAETGKPKPGLKIASIIIDGATLAVLFDWIMEPVAMDLGYWKWSGDVIPFYNYLSWFIVSSLLMAAFHFAQFNKRNKFAVNLLLIQMMFFLILRTLL